MFLQDIQPDSFQNKVKDFSLIADEILSNYREAKKFMHEKESIKALSIVDKTRPIKKIFNINHKIVFQLYHKKNENNDKIIEAIKEIEKKSIKLQELEDSLKLDFSFCNDNKKELSEFDFHLVNNLPFDWDWTSDLIIVLGIVDFNFIKEIKKRGQKRIWIINDNQAFFKEGELIFSNDIDNVELSSCYHLPPNKILLWNFQKDLVFANKIKSKIKFLQSSFRSNKTNLNNFLDLWLINGFHNLSNLNQNLNVSKIYNKFKDKKCIFVGAGPSLDKNILELKKNRKKIFLCACLHSLKSLETESIYPDMVIHADPLNANWIKKLIKDYDFKKIDLLLLSATVDKSLFNTQAKNIVWFNSNNYHDKWFCNIFNFFEVLHYPIGISIVALQILIKIGFNKIVFVGTDLADKKNSLYAKGSRSADDIYRHEQGYKTKSSVKTLILKGFFGKNITSSSFYLRQLRCLEETIKILKNNIYKIELFNCSEGGAYIEGFKHMQLKDLLQNNSENETPLKLRSILEEAKNEYQLERKEYINSIINYKAKFLDELYFLRESLTLFVNQINSKSEFNEEEFNKINNITSKVCDKHILLNLIFQNELNNLDKEYEYFKTDFKLYKIIYLYNNFSKKVNYLYKKLKYKN